VKNPKKVDIEPDNSQPTKCQPISRTIEL